MQYIIARCDTSVFMAPVVHWTHQTDPCSSHVEYAYSTHTGPSTPARGTCAPGDEENEWKGPRNWEGLRVACIFPWLLLVSRGFRFMLRCWERSTCHLRTPWPLSTSTPGHHHNPIPLKLNSATKISKGSPKGDRSIAKPGFLEMHLLLREGIVFWLFIPTEYAQWNHTWSSWKRILLYILVLKTNTWHTLTISWIFLWMFVTNCGANSLGSGMQIHCPWEPPDFLQQVAGTRPSFPQAAPRQRETWLVLSHCFASIYCLPSSSMCIFSFQDSQKYQTQITYSIQRMIFVSLERPFPSCPKRFTWRSTGPSDDNTYVKSYFKSWKKCPWNPDYSFVCAFGQRFCWNSQTNS